jgi:glycosyltransferase involved in cell wall biosynthesis
MAKYSFLLPAYKTSFLKEAIESILNQSYRDFLLIVSDDCSPEPVYSIVEPFLADNRVHYRRNNQNVGAERLTDHWNLLLSISSSEYVVFPGDDDVYEAHFLEKIDQLTQQYPEVDCIRCRTQRIDGTGTSFQTDIAFPQIQSQQLFLTSFYQPDSIHCLGNNVFRRSSLIQISGFPLFPFAWFSDDAAIIQLSKKGIATTIGIHFSFRSTPISISGNGEHICEKIQATRLFYQWVNQYPATLQNQAFRKNVKDYCYKYIMWSDLAQLDILEVIRLMWSLKSIRIGLSWLKRVLQGGHP